MCVVKVIPSQFEQFVYLYHPNIAKHCIKCFLFHLKLRINIWSKLKTPNIIQGQQICNGCYTVDADGNIPSSKSSWCTKHQVLYQYCLYVYGITPLKLWQRPKKFYLVLPSMQMWIRAEHVNLKDLLEHSQSKYRAHIISWTAESSYIISFVNIKKSITEKYRV